MRYFIVSLLFFLLSAPFLLADSVFPPTGKIEDKRLNELSGIVPVSVNEGYWGHNDGDSNEVYRFDAEGNIVQAVNLADIRNYDWEGMSTDESGRFFIIDHGYPHVEEKHFRILEFMEPSEDAEEIKEIKSYIFVYPDQQEKNCEAIFWLQGKIYIIIKRNQFDIKPKLYCIEPLKKDEIITAREVCTLDIQGRVTDASYSSKYKQLAVLTYHGIAFYHVEKESDLLKSPFHSFHGLFGQCEAVCYDGGNLVLTDEPGKIWNYPLKEFLEKDVVVSPGPKLVIGKTEQDPVIDGSLDEWKGDTVIHLKQDIGTKHQVRTEEDKAIRNIRMLWTDKGFYLGFEFTREIPLFTHGWGDVLLFMISPDLEEVFPAEKTRIYRIHYVQEDDELNLVVDRGFHFVGEGVEIVGKAAAEGNRIEAFIDEKFFPENPGSLYQFNMELIEFTETRYYLKTWYWSKGSWSWDRPLYWGVLELKE